MMTIRTKVSGVSFENRDGSERQRIIAKCKAGDRLYLRHDPDNEYSDFAIEVHHGRPAMRRRSDSLRMILPQIY